MPTPVAVATIDELYGYVQEALEPNLIYPDTRNRARYALLEIKRRLHTLVHVANETYGAQDSGTLSNLDCALNCVQTGKYDAR